MQIKTRLFRRCAWDTAAHSNSNATRACRALPKCCRGINIILTPYDIIQMKNRLGLSSREFLAIYTEPHLLEKTDLPMVTLKLLDDERESCPFVKDERDASFMRIARRPAATIHWVRQPCSTRRGLMMRVFSFSSTSPTARASRKRDADWTVAEWREDQGVDLRDEINREWTDLVVRKRSFPPNIKLTEKAKQMFFPGELRHR
jgi:hypothetical protein